MDCGPAVYTIEKVLCVKIYFALPKLSIDYRGLPKHSRYDENFIIFINSIILNAGRIYHVLRKNHNITSVITVIIDNIRERIITSVFVPTKEYFKNIIEHK